MARVPQRDTLRDTLLLVGGIGLVVVHILVQHQLNPTVLGLAVAMMGLPAALGLDRRRNGGT